MGVGHAPAPDEAKPPAHSVCSKSGYGQHGNGYLKAWVSLILGLSTALTYVLFSSLAAAEYPGLYSPWHNNTLSQLGNVNLNPNGAIYYQIGCAVTGLLLMGFFCSLGPWRSSGTVRQNRILLVVQVLGVFAGFGLLMNAVFPESNLSPHHFWAGVVFNSAGVAMLLSPFAFWRPGLQNVPITMVTLCGCALVIVMFAFSKSHWVEWLPVTVFLLSPGLLGLHTRSHHLAGGRNATRAGNP